MNNSELLLENFYFGRLDKSGISLILIRYPANELTYRLLSHILKGVSWAGEILTHILDWAASVVLKV